jgi:hypothetical protein
MLPTARLYSSALLYNLMNSRDLFCMLILTPHEKLSVCSDLHFIRLDESADRWYQGSGAVSANTAGEYAARASNGRSRLGVLLDIGLQWKLTLHWTAAGYYGHFFGGDVVDRFYNRDRDVDFGYLEMTVLF